MDLEFVDLWFQEHRWFFLAVALSDTFLRSAHIGLATGDARCYRKARLVAGLQQGEHTAPGVHTHEERSWNQRLPCVLAHSANIPRLSGVKADESHLA